MTGKMQVTTKIRIIFGFIFMTILILGMVIIGYNYIHVASDGFSNYSTQSIINTDISDMETKLSQSVLKTYNFLSSSDNELITKSNADIDEFIKIAKEVYNKFDYTDKKRIISSLIQKMEELRKSENDIFAAIGVFKKQYNENIRPSYNTMMELMRELDELAYIQRNSDAQHAMVSLWSGLAKCLTPLTRFAMNYSEAEGRTTLERLDALKGPLEKIQPQIVSDHSRRQQCSGSVHSGYHG